jgi:acyl carrier protein
MNEDRLSPHSSQDLREATHAIPHEQIRPQVIRIIVEMARKPEDEISLSDRVIADLGIDDEEIAYELVPRLEADFGAHVPWKEWAQARTVGDVISILERYAGTAPVGFSATRRLRRTHEIFILGICGALSALAIAMHLGLLTFLGVWLLAFVLSRISAEIQSRRE